MPLLGRMRRMRRRRVLAGAALVGGTAYYAGKKGQEAAEREAYQDARLDELEPQGQPASASVAAAPDTDALDKLAKLHEEGALTDEEFTAGKKEILGL
jgi:Short C-terminal domain